MPLSAIRFPRAKTLTLVSCRKDTMAFPKATIPAFPTRVDVQSTQRVLRSHRVPMLLARARKPSFPAKVEQNLTSRQRRLGHCCNPLPRNFKKLSPNLLFLGTASRKCSRDEGSFATRPRTPASPMSLNHMSKSSVRRRGRPVKARPNARAPSSPISVLSKLIDNCSRPEKRGRTAASSQAPTPRILLDCSLIATLRALWQLRNIVHTDATPTGEMELLDRSRSTAWRDGKQCTLLKSTRTPVSLSPVHARLRRSR
mmetsp:Transcript_33645/g.81407  ORF Transcript_33645/g.81407 Transcript_33645/m.81407 type:complete len:256 (-) Transcript_33645:360-1127(-)